MVRILCFFLLLAPLAQAAHLEVAAQFPDRQVTGVTVSRTGRLFVSFPHWEEFKHLSVAEVLPGGVLKPFPLEWDQDGPGSAAAGVPSTNAFFCVQSVVCDDQDMLWILDTGSPGLAGVVPGQAKLVGVDLATGRAKKVIVFSGEAAPPKSYINDVRIDTARKVAYLSDSGLGGVLVVDLEKGGARRVLQDHPSTQPEEGFALQVNGKVLRGPDGKSPRIASDGIELSADKAMLYYHALTGRTLYSVPTAALRDPALKPAELAAQVRAVADTGPVDGLGLGKDGRIYLSCLEDGVIRSVVPGEAVQEVCRDPRFLWPDTFATGPDGSLYFTCSQVENMPRFNGGKSARTAPYAVFRLFP
ncbi:MAG: L-dopachrome tautomerase-related protein [Verrucomicrobium sp.]|nr:L-dopachrome tautomerase-related protein [Verrucomicrobium sp.]